MKTRDEALIELAEEWEALADEAASASARIAYRDCAAELRRAVEAHDQTLMLLGRWRSMLLEVS